MDNFRVQEFDHGGELQIASEETADRAPVTRLVYSIDYGAEGCADFLLPTDNKVNGDTYIIKNLNGENRSRDVAPQTSVTGPWGTNFEFAGIYNHDNRFGLWDRGQTVTIVWSDASNLTGWFVVASSVQDSVWSYAR